MNTPITDAEEQRQRAIYDLQREVGWPAFDADFNLTRKMEIALRQIEDHHGETEGWREIAREALNYEPTTQR